MSEELESEVVPSERSQIATNAALARAQKLSPERRKEISRAAAKARWSTTLPRATNDGDLIIAGRRISCAVLETKQRVLTQQTFLTAVGRAAKAKGGQGSERLVIEVDELPPFLSAKNLSPFISDEVRKMATPVVFRTVTGGIGYGYDAHLLTRVCGVYQKARDAHLESLRAFQKQISRGEKNVEFKGVLQPSQEHIVRAVDELMRDIADDGVIAMVDRATGYIDQDVLDEIKQNLRLYIAPHLLPWTEKFDQEFFKEVYRLYGWKFKPKAARHPQYIGKFINKYIYGCMPRGVLEKLQTENPVMDNGHRKTQHHRLLTTHTGVQHLDKQIVSTTTVMKMLDDKAGTKNFEKLFYKVHPLPMQQNLLLQEPAKHPDQDQPSLFPAWAVDAIKSD